MNFTKTRIEGAFVVEPQPVRDERGSFARTFCARELEANGLNPRLAQCSASWNHKRGTLRGMHYQAPPHAEVRLVRCTAGAVYDVVVDLRPGSATFKGWFAAELSAANGRMLYIPEGLAHGFQTLADRTEVYYHMSEFYVPESALGVRWNDPAFGIEWPEAETRILSPRDAAWADFKA